MKEQKKPGPLRPELSTLPEELEKLERAMLEPKKAERQGELFGDEDHDWKAKSDVR